MNPPCPACGHPACRERLYDCTNTYCRHGTTDNNQPRPGQTHDHGACTPCLTFTRRAINDLPEQYVTLYLKLDKPSGFDEKVSGSRLPPTPLNEHIEALMRHVCAWLEQWETEARERADLRVRSNRHDAPPHPAIPQRSRSTREGWSITQAVKTITAHLQRITDDEDVAGVFIDELAALRRSLLWTLGAYRGKTRSHVPCPACDTRAVVRVNGTEQYDCEACGAVFVEQDFDRYAKLLVWQQQNGESA